MYKIHKDGWSAATKEDIDAFIIKATYGLRYVSHEINGNAMRLEYGRSSLVDVWELTEYGLMQSINGYFENCFTLLALEVGLLGKAQLEWVKRDDYSQRSDHYYAFVPTNEDGSAGFVLQAAYSYAWKGKPEVFQIAIYAVAHDKPVDVSKNCIGPVLLHEVLDGMTYLDQPAPMIEAEQALRQILKGGLNQLQFTTP